MCPRIWQQQTKICTLYSPTDQYLQANTTASYVVTQLERSEETKPKPTRYPSLEGTKIAAINTGKNGHLAARTLELRFGLKLRIRSLF